MKKVEQLNVLAMILPLVGLLILPGELMVAIIIIAFQLICIGINKKAYCNERKESHLNNNFIFSIIVLSIILFIFAALSSNAIANLKTTILVIGSIVVYGLLYITDAKKEKTFKNTMKWIVYITIFLCIYAIIIRIFGNQYIIQVNKRDFKQTLEIGGIVLEQSACSDAKYGFIVGSLTKNPNSLSYLCLFSLIANFFGMANTKKLKKIINNIVLLGGLLISASRLAILLVPVAYLIYYFYKKKIHEKSFAIAIILIAVIVLVFIVVLNINTLLTTIDFNGRLSMWNIAAKEIGIVGKGLGTDLILLEQKLGEATSMHNSYISLGINAGMPIMIIIILFNIITLIKKIKEISDEQKALPYVIYTLLLVISLVESVFFVFGAYNYWFWYCLFNLYVVNEGRK